MHAMETHMLTHNTRKSHNGKCECLYNIWIYVIHMVSYWHLVMLEQEQLVQEENGYTQRSLVPCQTLSTSDLFLCQSRVINEYLFIKKLLQAWILSIIKCFNGCFCNLNFAHE